MIPIPILIPEPLGRIGLSARAPGSGGGAAVAVPRGIPREAALALKGVVVGEGLGKGCVEAAGLTAACPCVRRVPVPVAFPRDSS